MILVPTPSPNLGLSSTLKQNWTSKYHKNCDNDMSLVVRKTFFCICENKDADQLRNNCEADQRLCLHYTDSTIPLLPKSENSSF